MTHAIISFLNPIERVTFATQAKGNYHFSDNRRPVHADQSPDVLSTHYYKYDTPNREGREISAAEAQWYLKIWNYRHCPQFLAHPHPVSTPSNNPENFTGAGVRSWGDRYWTINLKKIAICATLAGVALKIVVPNASLPNIAAYASLAAMAVLGFANQWAPASVPGGYLAGHLGVLLARGMHGLRA